MKAEHSVHAQRYLLSYYFFQPASLEKKWGGGSVVEWVCLKEELQWPTILLRDVHPPTQHLSH